MMQCVEKLFSTLLAPRGESISDVQDLVKGRSSVRYVFQHLFLDRFFWSPFSPRLLDRRMVSMIHSIKLGDTLCCFSKCGEPRPDLSMSAGIRFPYLVRRRVMRQTVRSVVTVVTFLFILTWNLPSPFRQCSPSFVLLRAIPCSLQHGYSSR